MKTKMILTIISVIFILMGSIWFLQGINVIGGSRMTGQSVWAVNGAIAVVVGIALFVYANWNKILRR